MTLITFLKASDCSLCQTAVFHSRAELFGKCNMARINLYLHLPIVTCIFVAFW